MTFAGTTRSTARTPSRGAFDLSPTGTRLRAKAWSGATFALTVACLALTAAIAFARWQLQGAVVPWDSKNQFYPFFRFLGDALRHGIVPFWNPYQFAGYPAVADPQSLIFTPTMVLAALVAPTASMPLFDAIVFLHLLAGGIGMLGLARRWRWHPAAGVLAGLVFMLGGAAASRLQHTGMIVSYAWFLPALWCLQAALDRRSWRLALGAGVLAALMALGRDQVAFLFCLALAGAVLRQAFRSGHAPRYLRSRAPVLACAAALIMAAIIVPVLLTLQFLQTSNRPGIAYGMALQGSLDPINFLTMIAPNVFGSLDRTEDYWGPGAGTLAGTDWTDRTIDYLFVGTLPVVLLVWHGLAGKRVFERGARSFALLLLFGLVYALGRHTPLFNLIFDWLPGVSLYRRPADASFVINVALAFAAGFLLHRFIEDGVPTVDRGCRRAPALTLVGSAALVVFGLRFADAAGHLDTSVVALARGALFFLGVVLVLVVGRARVHRPLVAQVLVAATAVQLVWSNSASPLNAEPATSYGAYAGPTQDEARGLAVLEAELARRKAQGARPRVELLGLGGSWENAAMVFKIEDTLGYNPLRIDAYEAAVGAGENATDKMLRDFPDTFRGYNSTLARLLGLDYLVLDCPIESLPQRFPRPRATLLFAGKTFYVYRLDNAAVPRVYVASRLVATDDVAALDGEMPRFDPETEALVDRRDLGKIDLGTTPSGSTAAKSTAVITRYADDRVTVSVAGDVQGLLVLHDLAYPGWTATVDGREAALVRANLLFRGVGVPAGHHMVEFAFHPLSAGNLEAAARGLLGKVGQ